MCLKMILVELQVQLFNQNKTCLYLKTKNYPNLVNLKDL